MSTRTRTALVSGALVALAAASVPAPVGAGTGVIIDTDLLTVTGDGDSDPQAIHGVPFTTAALPSGLAGFFVQGDLTIPAGEIVSVVGARALSLWVAGDLTIETGAVMDASALGTTPGPGGGAGAAAPTGGQGGSGFANPNSPPGGPGGSGDTGFGEDGTKGANALTFPGGLSGQPGKSASGSAGLNSPGSGAMGGAQGGSGGGGAAGLATGVVTGGPGGSGGGLFSDGSGGGPGTDGVAGSPGDDGGDGKPGAGGVNTGSGLPISGGGGGGSGGSGGGGGGGGSGSPGAGGGGGGSGGGTGLSSGGSGGRGGYGGTGGTGGKGGVGGPGGPGGAGGGAMELVVLGRLVVAGTLSADGGRGREPTAVGSPGAAGAGGASGEFGKSGSAGGTAAGDGGRGGDGGDGATGGRGGSGGDGGAGAGGGGGTVRLAALRIDAGDALVSVRGGAGASGGDADSVGGPGRFLFEPGDGAAFSGTLVGADAPETATFRPVQPNPFIEGSPQTPIVPFVSGGPDTYGRANGIADAVIDGWIADAPPWAALALVRVDQPSDVGLDWDLDGHDLLLVANVRTCPVRAPRLGVGTSVANQPLLERGPARLPEFGGTGPVIVGMLGAREVYATVVPEGQSDYATTSLHGSATISSYTVGLPYGVPTYVEQPAGEPDCTVFVDLTVPMRIPRIDSLHAVVPTPDGDLDLDLTLGFDERGRLAATGPCTFGGEDVSVGGRVLLRRGVPTVDVSVSRAGDGTKVRVVGAVDLNGPSTATATFRPRKGRRTRSDVELGVAGTPVMGDVLLLPSLDERGRVSGTATIVAGFGNDVPGPVKLSGRFRGKRLTFSARAAGRLVRFSGRLHEGEFIGTLTVRTPPESGRIPFFGVRDFRLFH